MTSSAPKITEDFYPDLERTLTAAKTKADLYRAIVQAPFDHAKEVALLFMGFLCYFSVDRNAKVIRLETATRNEYYEQAVLDYDFDHDSFEVPFTATTNSMIEAALKKRPVSLTNWDKMRRPNVEAGVARLNQATSGIAYTVIMPIGDAGVLGFNFFQPKEELGESAETFVERYSALVTDAISKY